MALSFLLRSLSQSKHRWPAEEELLKRLVRFLHTLQCCSLLSIIYFLLFSFFVAVVAVVAVAVTVTVAVAATVFVVAAVVGLVVRSNSRSCSCLFFLSQVSFFLFFLWMCVIFALFLSQGQFFLFSCLFSFLFSSFSSSRVGLYSVLIGFFVQSLSMACSLN